jgi:hypothetical protein
MKLSRLAGLAIALGLSLGELHAASGHIIKTLPHFLDLDGKHTLHPSLFARDTYQLQLKNHPELCSGMRFDVQWKARKLKSDKVMVKLELRGFKSPPRQSMTLSTLIDPPAFMSRWTSLAIAGQEFKELGGILAWRITLWDGEEQFAEQTSFLW